MPDNVVKASNQVASWNVVNTTATINTPSTNVQTLPRNVICNAILTKRVSDITNSCFNYKTSTYIDLPKCTDRSMCITKSEGSQGFVIPGSQILMQTTNKMANDENLAPKPDYSYASMICQAIFSSSGKKSTLAEIYEWICSTYPFFKRNQQGWKNSIRHNLSLNAAFVRASRGEGVTGKGGYWMVDPKYERYFVNGHFKPPSSETKSSYKRSKLLDENEMIITTSKATAVANKKNGTIQSHKQSHNQVAREKLRQIKDNIEAAVQITLQLKDEKNVSSLKKKAKVEIVKNVEKVTETINCEDIPTGPEKDREKIMIAEGCDEVYRRYYDGNDPNWRSDAEFFASFSPFL